MDGIRVGIDAQEALPPVRGAGVAVSQLVSQMARLSSGTRFTVFTATFRPVLPEFPEEALLLLRRVRHPIPNALPPAAFHAVRERVFLPLAAAWHRLDVFHGFPYLPPLPSGVRGIATLLDFSAFLYPEAGAQAGGRPARMRTRLRETLARADAILAISDYVRTEGIEQFGLSPGKVRAVPLAASAAFRPLPEKEHAWPRPPGLGTHRYFLWSGVIEPRKNLPALFRAFRAYASSGGHAHLVLAGPGPLGRTARAIAEAPELEGARQAVHDAGRLGFGELAAAMNGALAFVFPSRYEGFGLPLLEAMACGAPCVAARAASLPEVGGDACLWFDPDDDAALAEHLVRLADDPSLREDLSRRGLARSRLFSWERTARETLRVYEEVLEGRWA